ncbi:MAG: hypothetical protein ACYTFY_00040 [Planctomycetota bacterium]|jgi:hypothetical protein
MQSKLSGLMALMAFMLLAGTWCMRRLLGLPVMDPVQVLSSVLIVLPLYYFVVGRIVSRIGISLIQEQLADVRAREEEMVHQAQMLSGTENIGVDEDDEDDKSESEE